MKNLNIYFLSAICMLMMQSCQNSEDSPIEEKKIQTTPSMLVNNTSNLNDELMLLLVNEVRAKGCNCIDQQGKATVMPKVPSLSWNDTLTVAAIRHSEDMSANKYFSHDNLKKQTVGDRVTQTGYKWSAVAENIARGQKSEREVFEGWMKSYGHCKNIMNKDVKEIGVARSTTGSIPYWTQVFAAKMN